MKDKTNKQNDHLDPKSKKAGQQDKKNLPERGTDENTDTGGSMSEGNLSNSRYSRERTRSTHDKTGVMGSDNDGQAN